jgi:type IV pilus assembly protein PilA
MNTGLNKIRIGRFNHSGFTLVELMIVVAIIGILSSIAIPNYQRYQAKARTAEAKLYLSSAYTAEKSFVVEYSSYTSCLAAAGFGLDSNQNYYGIGFLSASATGTTCGQSGNVACNLDFNDGTTPLCSDASGATFFAASKKARSASTLPGQSDLAGSAVATNTFTVTAAGQISPTNATNDTWTINEQKLIRQTSVGF